jgi:hypothetical protein
MIETSRSGFGNLSSLCLSRLRRRRRSAGRKEGLTMDREEEDEPREPRRDEEDEGTRAPWRFDDWAAI